MKLKTIAIMLCALAFAGAVQAAAAVPQHNDQVADLAGLMGQVVQTNTQLAQANRALVSELRAEKKNPGIYQAGKQFAKALWTGTPKVYLMLSVLGARCLHAVLYRPAFRTEGIVIGSAAAAAAAAWRFRGAIGGWFAKKFGFRQEAASA